MSLRKMSSAEEESLVIRSGLTPIRLPEKTFAEYFAEKIRAQNLEQPALISPRDGCQLTFGQMDRQIRELATGMARTEIVKQDLVLFFAQNSLQYALCMLAITYMGVTFTPVSPANGPFELTKQLKDFRTTVVIIDHAKLPIFLKAMDQSEYDNSINIKLMVVMNGPEQDPEAGRLMQHARRPQTIQTYQQVYRKGAGHPTSRVPMYPTGLEDHYVILYTSGTSGLPKGAIHTQRTWLASIVVEEQTGNVDGGRELLILPMGHMGGTLLLAKILLSGATCILCTEGTSLDETFILIEKYQINYLLFTPDQAIQIANGDYHRRYDVESLKLMQTGGAKIPANILTEIRRKFPLVKLMEIYGSTEFSGAFQIRNYGQPECLPGNVGTLVANYEMKIQDLVTGQNLPANRTGEICLRGPMCFAGYLNNPLATKETIDQDGWYHSGDIGYYDQFQALHIEDRLKEMIKYQGWSLIPAAIEDFLHQHPAVESVCVVGVPHTNDGQWLRAYVQLKSSFSEDNHDHVAQTLHQMIEQNLGPQKKLRAGIRFLSHMPRTLIGKVDRKYFKHLVQNELID